METNCKQMKKKLYRNNLALFIYLELLLLLFLLSNEIYLINFFLKTPFLNDKYNDKYLNKNSDLKYIFKNI